MLIAVHNGVKVGLVEDDDVGSGGKGRKGDNEKGSDSERTHGGQQDLYDEIQKRKNEKTNRVQMGTLRMVVHD